MHLAGEPTGEGSALLVLNGSREDAEVTLPAAPGATAYRMLWDSAEERPSSDTATGTEHQPGPVTVPATSLRLYTTGPDGPRGE
jgi:isoamylase